MTEVSFASPTLIFVGVSTARSAIVPIFPLWMAALGLPDARLHGWDLPLGAPAASYRAVAQRLRTDPLVRGALITSHKLDLLAAARDLLDWLDPDAALLEEVSCIARRGERLLGFAKDPAASALALDALLAPDHWRHMRGTVLCLGDGGAALAITTALLRRDPADAPARLEVVGASAARLAHLRKIHRQLGSPIPLSYVQDTDSANNDARIAALPAGSLAINATGMGKDRPGSPTTDAVCYPTRTIAWELNYRGTLDFLRQARRQDGVDGVRVRDGWDYFLRGWTAIIAEVFERRINAADFARLSDIAAAVRLRLQR